MRADWRAFDIIHERRAREHDDKGFQFWCNRHDYGWQIDEEGKDRGCVHCCPHEDFTENQEGDRTCTACGLTTDAPEPGHPNGCICATCAGADLSADND